MINFTEISSVTVSFFSVDKISAKASSHLLALCVNRQLGWGEGDPGLLWSSEGSQTPAPTLTSCDYLGNLSGEVIKKMRARALL